MDLEGLKDSEGLNDRGIKIFRGIKSLIRPRWV